MTPHGVAKYAFQNPASAMVPELGSFALILALLLAAVQGTLPLVGAQRRISA